MSSSANQDRVPPLRKSLLHHLHVEAGAKLLERHGCIQVASYRAEDDQQVRQLGLIDLSTHRRAGLKGYGAIEWLKRQDVVVPHEPNRAVPMSDGSLVARLSFEEHLFLSSVEGVSELVTDALSWSASGSEVLAEGAFTVPRQDSHAWLFLSGAQAVTMMSFVCAINLKPNAFANGQIAQTSVARLNAIVIRQDIGLVPGFHLLCDTPSVEYWWDALLDAALPLGGRAVGVDGLIRLHRQQSVNR